MPSRADSSTTTSSKMILEKGMICMPILFNGSMVTPLALAGTRYMDICLFSGEGSSFLQTTMKPSEFSPEVTQVLVPLMWILPSFLVAVVVMYWLAEPASGSEMARQYGG